MELSQEQELLDNIKAHALTSPTREICGLVLSRSETTIIFPCRNIATDNNEFILDPYGYIEASKYGKIIAVYHSHPNYPAKASEADVISCDRSSLPWLIYSLPDDRFCTIYPSNKLPDLIGRKYYSGLQDCWTLVKDVYKKDLGIDVLDIGERKFNWWLNNINYFEGNVDRAGFKKVTNLEVYDVILMSIGKTTVPNHCGVLMPNGHLLHHLINKPSGYDIYGGYWKKCTSGVYRYAKKD